MQQKQSSSSDLEENYDLESSILEQNTKENYLIHEKVE